MHRVLVYCASPQSAMLQAATNRFLAVQYEDPEFSAWSAAAAEDVQSSGSFLGGGVAAPFVPAVCPAGSEPGASRSIVRRESCEPEVWRRATRALTRSRKAS